MLYFAVWLLWAFAGLFALVNPVDTVTMRWLFVAAWLVALFCMAIMFAFIATDKKDKQGKA